MLGTEVSRSQRQQLGNQGCILETFLKCPFVLSPIQGPGAAEMSQTQRQSLRKEKEGDECNKENIYVWVCMTVY